VPVRIVGPFDRRERHPPAVGYDLLRHRTCSGCYELDCCSLSL